jgi:hypothetical protein
VRDVNDHFAFSDVSLINSALKRILFRKVIQSFRGEITAVIGV